MFYWIYDYPTWQVGALFAVVILALSLGGLLAFRAGFSKWFHTERRASDMVAVALGSFSVLYGILLGLVAVGAYQNFSDVTQLVDKEAACLSAMYRDVSALPQPYKDRLEADLRSYTRYTIDYGWPAQRRGHTIVGSTQRMTVLFNDLTSFQPTDKRSEIIFAEAFRQLNNLTEVRRSRLNSVTTGIPAVPSRPRRPRLDLYQATD